MSDAQRVLVTGGNAGIGLALCKQLLTEHGCHVYLGSRSEEKGKAAIEELLEACPDASGRLELLQIDVSRDDSVAAAAEALRGLMGEAKLYGLVNNAGTGLGHGVTKDEVMNTNLYGTKRMVETFVPLLDPSRGRIVNVGSTAGPMWIAEQDEATRKMLTSRDVTLAQIEETVKALPSDADDFEVYSRSKACMHAYTLTMSKELPNFLISMICPGLIDTQMTKGTGFGATKQPNEGTVSIKRCLFDQDLPGSGFFYICDGSRRPLDKVRQPGDPADQDE